MIKHTQLIAMNDEFEFYEAVKEAIDKQQDKGLKVDVQFSTATTIGTNEFGITECKIRNSALILARD